MRYSHLALLCDEQAPSDILDQIYREVEAESLNIRRQSSPSTEPQGSLETILPTFVAVYLLRPYFEGFLKEAGKDHYAILKKALKNTWNRLFNRNDDFRVALLTSSGEVKLEYSLLFSILAETRSGQKVKLLIREGCSENECSVVLPQTPQPCGIGHHLEPLCKAASSSPTNGTFRSRNMGMVKKWSKYTPRIRSCAPCGKKHEKRAPSMEGSLQPCGNSANHRPASGRDPQGTKLRSCGTKLGQIQAVCRDGGPLGKNVAARVGKEPRKRLRRETLGRQTRTHPWLINRSINSLDEAHSPRNRRRASLGRVRVALGRAPSF